MYCEKGCSEEYILKLTNNGPIPVIYKFVWIKETINIIRDIEVGICHIKRKISNLITISN